MLRGSGIVGSWQLAVGRFWSAECWVLSAECWVLSAGCWVLRAERKRNSWQLAVGSGQVLECWVLSGREVLSAEC